jgi:hypothetical protein
MKAVDDYKAKVKLWARQPRVAPLPPPTPLLKFTAQKFRTHAEMNRWKESLLREIARGVARNG